MFDGPRHIDTDPKERLARLRLARSPRIGAVTFHEALAHFGSARAACAEVSAISAAQAEREQERLEAMGGQFVVWDLPATECRPSGGDCLRGGCCLPNRRSAPRLSPGRSRAAIGSSPACPQGWW